MSAPPGRPLLAPLREWQGELRTIRPTAKSRHVRAIAALTLLAALLRFPTLDLQSFWSDEAITVLLVRMDLGGMLEMIARSESTPPLYYVLAWPWTRVFGSGEIGLRSLSALAGTVAVPLAAASAWTLISRRAAVVTAALVAVNPLLVWYSQEARAYSLFVSMVALSFLLFARALQGPTPWRLAAWAAASVLAFATHYFAAFAVAPAAVVLLVARRRRRTIVAVAAVLFGGLALAPLALAQRGTGNAEWIARSPLDSRLVEIPKQLLVGRAAPLDRPLAVLATALVLAGVALILLRAAPSARRGAGLAAVVGLSALAVPVAMALVGLDYLIAQNVLTAVVPLSVAVSAGFAVPTPRRLAAATLAALCVLSLILVAAVALDPAYQRTNWRETAGAVSRPRGERLIVVDNDFGGSFARIPFQLYLPEARAVDEGLASDSQRFPEELRRRPSDHATPQEVRTQELAFVNAPRPLPCARRRFLEAFTLMENHGDGYSLQRYRSPTPVDVAPRTIADCLRGHDLAILRQAG